jgi:ornithine cyclodeaminase/alanine dehydrogenase-like protein (mu-crystallin family)
VTSTNPPVRVLTRSQVRSVLRWPELIEATGRALIAVAAEGSSTAATSGQLRVPGASVHLKSGALLDPPVLSVKANMRPDAGSSAGVIVAFDPVHFTVRAVLDSADITAMRTAAIAAVAARHLAGPGGHSVALIGTGPVGRQSAAALSQVLGIREFRLWSRDRARAEHVAGTLRPPASVFGSVGEAAAGADVVLTATPSREPLLAAESLAAKTLILAMGADSPGKRELGEGVLDGAALVADVPDGAFSVGEFAYLAAAADRSRCAGIGELLAGRRTLPASGRIVFDAVGTAVVDAAAVGLALDVAESLDLGTLIDLTA